MEQPMPSSNGVAEHQLQTNEAHEERIQRLETSMTTIATKQAESLTKLEFLGEKVEEGYASIASKIDKAFDQVADRLDKGAEKIDANDKRIAAVETSEKARAAVEAADAARSVTIKKILFPLLIAAGSVAATGLGQMLWTWLTR